MKTNDIFNFNNDTAAISDVGLVRKQNEDSFGYTHANNSHVFVVCDGMGGHVGGKIASETAVNAIMNFFNSNLLINIPKGMEEAIKYANKAVYEKARQNPDLKGMGTTIVLTIIKEDKVYIGYVGDSRIYLFTDNKLIRLTKDHSYVQELFNRGIITDDEMRYHSRKNEITRALGLIEDVEPEVAKNPLLLKNGDVLLLCSDGLTDMVDDTNIRQVMTTTPDVKKAAKQLLNMALSAGGKDNTTIQLIKITNSNYKESIYINQNNVSNDKVAANDVTLIDENPVRITSNNIKPAQNKSFFNNINFNNPKVLGIIIGGLALLLFLIWEIFSYLSGPDDNEKNDNHKPYKTENILKNEKSNTNNNDKSNKIINGNTNKVEDSKKSKNNNLEDSVLKKTTPETPEKIKVKKGMTLNIIAKKYNIDVEYLKKINKLKDDKIKEGQVLILKEKK